MASQVLGLLVLHAFLLPHVKPAVEASGVPTRLTRQIELLGVEQTCTRDTVSDRTV